MIEWNTPVLEELLRGPGGPVAAYLGRVGAIVGSRAQLNLSREGGVDLGRLRGSITHVVARDGDDLAVFVGTNVLYALPVHNGRRPGAKMPPVDAILDWARHKKMVDASMTESEQRGVAFVIARSIARRGIKARPFLVEALPAARGVI